MKTPIDRQTLLGLIFTKAATAVIFSGVAFIIIGGIDGFRIVETLLYPYINICIVNALLILPIAFIRFSSMLLMKNTVRIWVILNSFLFSIAVNFKFSAILIVIDLALLEMYWRFYYPARTL